jgi:PPOX class probable F420-dependent enzyme
MAFDDLDGERFLSIASFRSDGTAVPTPVWFAHSENDLVVGTFSDSGKVTRIRSNPTVEVAACNFRGLEKGPYLEATARIAEGPDAERAASALIDKYGWQWTRFGRRVDTYLVISPR